MEKSNAKPLSTPKERALRAGPRIELTDAQSTEKKAMLHFCFSFTHNMQARRLHHNMQARRLHHNMQAGMSTPQGGTLEDLSVWDFRFFSRGASTEGRGE